MSKIEHSRALIQSAVNPVLLLSGGIDSILTLFLVRKLFDVPVIAAMQDFNKSQRRAIEKLVYEWDLTCYTAPPVNRYFVPNERSVSLIDEYIFGGAVMPVIRDFEYADTACALELNGARSSGIWLGWQTVLTGLLKTDAHPATGFLAKTALFKSGEVNFISPLFDWTKAEIQAAAADLDLLKYVAVPDTGDVQACVKCLEVGEGGKVFCHRENKKIARRIWQRAEMLKEFQNKYGFEV